MKRNGAKKLEERTWVYLIKDIETGYHKIGESFNPHERLRQLCFQNTNQPRPNDYSIVEAWWATVRDECELQKKFELQCVRDPSEWFDLSDDGHGSDVWMIRQYFALHQPYSSTLVSREIDDLVWQLKRSNTDLSSEVERLQNSERWLTNQLKSAISEIRHIRTEGSNRIQELAKELEDLRSIRPTCVTCKGKWRGRLDGLPSLVKRVGTKT